MGKIFVIGLTGGPCAGKTESLQNLVSYFAQTGHLVLPMDETATYLINNGISPRTVGNPEFQAIQLKLQLAKEASYREMADNLLAHPSKEILTKMSVNMDEYKDTAIIICDRTALDGIAFSEKGEFEYALDDVGVTTNDLISGYDGLINLVSVAKDAPQFYTLGNNRARTETVFQALVAQQKIDAIASMFPNCIYVDNSTDMMGKIERTVNGFCKIMGEPIPFKDYEEKTSVLENMNTLTVFIKSIPRGETELNNQIDLD